MAEKDLNEISRDARSLFARGSQALAQDNFDYAITLLNQALELEPGFFHCRKALRDAQFRKAGDTGKGFFKKMLSRAGSSPQEAKARMALGKNPAEAMAIAEQILNGDPNSSAAHRIIVDAGNALELPRTVVLSYETLAKNSPKDKALAIEYAHAVSAIGEGSRAEKIIMDLMRELPGDGELRDALKDLSARKTLDEGGYGALEGGGGSYRDILKNKNEAVSLEQEKRVQKIRGRRRAPHRRIRDAPSHRAEQPQARPLARRTLHPEKTV